jgi:ABC-2 type transport system permease protein
MVTLLQKEINAFLSSLTGYFVLAVFLLAIGLFVWVIPDVSILEMGYASLDAYFDMAPRIFLFLIPAITMRLLSEERKQGTFELLATKPLKDWEIIGAKYLAAVILVTIALLPTLIYFYSVSALGDPVGNLDTGASWGSYIGLLLLAACFVSIGIFASAVTDNQVVAFIIGVFLCYVFYLGFEHFSELALFYGKTDSIVKAIGIHDHFLSISRGVVDLRDIIYFLTLQAAFLSAATLVITSRKW